MAINASCALGQSSLDPQFFFLLFARLTVALIKERIPYAFKTTFYKADFLFLYITRYDVWERLESFLYAGRPAVSLAALIPSFLKQI